MANHQNNGNGNSETSHGLRLKVGLAEMLKGGVIMDVINAEQAEIAEKAGAVAVMALCSPRSAASMTASMSGTLNTL